MPNGFTITNLPEAAEPSTLAEVTALVTAVGTALSGVAIPVLLLVVVIVFRRPFADLIRNLSSFEAPGGVKVVTHDRLTAKTDAVEELAADQPELPPLPDPAEVADQPEPTEEADQSVPSPLPLPVDAADSETVAAKPADSSQDEPAANDRPTAAPILRDAEWVAAMVKRIQALEAPPPTWYQEITPNDAYVDKRTFEDLLLSHPASAVLFVWNEVETDLRALAKKHGIIQRRTRVPPRILIDKLTLAGAMPTQLADLLHEMLRIRADALHNGGQINERIALEYRNSGMVAGKEIGRQIMRSPPPAPSDK